ncbi:MAG: hypothetical protein LBI06_06265, partial [Treponema sp.]|nr:hypothetical protein [Treponema sp.]
MKRIFFLLFMPIFCNAIFCDEIVYVVTQDTELSLERNNMYKEKIKEGETVFYQGGIRDVHIVSFSPLQTEPEILVRTERGVRGWIFEKYLVLQDSPELPAMITERPWIYSFYQQFISGAKKEKMFDYEPFWRDGYDDYMNRWLDWEHFDDYDPWWLAVDPTKFFIQNNMITIWPILLRHTIFFAIANRQQDADVISLRVVCASNGTMRDGSILIPSYLNRFNEGYTYQLTFKVDGDYMDVFVNNETKEIATLISVDDYFGEAVHNYFQNKPIDLTR